MQEEGTLLSKFPLVQLATPSKGSEQKSDNNKATAAADDTVDSPHASPATSKQNTEKTEDELIATTSSNITVDSNTVAEALVSLVYILLCEFHDAMPIIRLWLLGAHGY